MNNPATEKLLIALDAVQGNLETAIEAQDNPDLYDLRLRYVKEAGQRLQQRIDQWKRSEGVHFDVTSKVIGGDGMKVLWWADYRDMTYAALDGRRSPQEVLVEIRTLRVVLRILGIENAD